MSLVFYSGEIHLTVTFFHRKAGAERGDWKVVAFGKPPSKRAFPSENLYLHMVFIYSRQFRNVSGVNIMQMDSPSGFG